MNVLVIDIVKRLVAAIEPDEALLGGGNTKKLKMLPPRCRAGDKANAFAGGFRLWEKVPSETHHHTAKRPPDQRG